MNPSIGQVDGRDSARVEGDHDVSDGAGDDGVAVDQPGPEFDLCRAGSAGADTRREPSR